jgi:hypothetical protein
MGSVVQIRMPLRGEDVDVWRPVLSRPLGGELFMIDLQPIPETEDWAFAPGDVVRCLDRTFADGRSYATAIALVPEEPGTVRRWLELHDSVLEHMRGTSDTVDLQLRGYVHKWEARARTRFGLGSMQPILVQIFGARLPFVLEGPVGISDGSLVAGSARYPNMVPLPLRTSGTEFALELADGRILEISGTHCTIDSNGAASFVEVLPGEIDPGEPA